MSGDPLFPFPEPSFLFIHSVLLFGPDQTTKVQDERGKTTVKVAEPGDPNYPSPVSGYLTAADPQSDTSGYMLRENISAVLLLPNNTGIGQGWVISCHDPLLPPDLAGTYDVNTTRPNISHTRVMLSRFKGVWGRWEN